MRPVTSASNIDRRRQCPGSERMEAGFTDEDSKESREGTLLHKLDADPSLDRSKLKPNQRDLLETAARLDEVIFEAVDRQFGVGDLKHTKAWHMGRVMGGRERTMFLHRGIKSLFPGTCDLWAYFPDKKLLVIIDKKFGYKEQTFAAANMQLRAYAVMGAEQHDVEHCVVAITQPRLEFKKRLTMAVYGRDEIKASREQLYEIWDNSKKPDAPLVVGEEQCRYCKAKDHGICPAYNAAVKDGLAIIPSPTGNETVAARESRIEQAAAQASDPELAEVYRAIQLAGFAKDPVSDEIRRRIQAGGMPGFRLGKAKDMRNVIDVAAAVERLESAGIAKEKIMACCSMSLGDDGGIAEVWRDTKGGTWKAAKDGINALLGDAIEHSTSRPSIEKVKEALPER